MAAPKDITPEALEERRKSAYAYRRGGANLARIALTLGISIGQASKDIKFIRARAIKETNEDVAEQIFMQNDRYDTLLEALWDKAKNGDGPAIDRSMNILAAQRQLLGLDAPRRTDISSLGQSIAPPPVDLSALDDEELDQLEKIQSKLAASKRNPSREGAPAA